MFKRLGLKNPHDEFEGQWKNIKDIEECTKNFSKVNYQDYGLIQKYCSKKSKTLEAGCGYGQFLIGLYKDGYNIQGVDIVKHAIDNLHKYYPEIKATVGDCTKLDYPDNHFTQYISLGVVEHLEEGPDPFLKEAHRVLKKDGVALITVPNFDGLVYSSRNDPKHTEFFQYEFTKDEFLSILKKNNFEILECVYTNFYSFLYIKFFFLRALDRKPYRLNLIGKMIERMIEIFGLGKYCGAMISSVVRPIKNSKTNK